ncbi:MAG: short-chain alcohol dehydrogenase [Ilumatobacteraceae bacterium]|nr:short-chain alcohol dehydrogenase [Ilumatobacteraceae bacterium]
MSKVWFITGSSKGFGRVWAEAALERGDQVAATARNIDSLQDLVGRYGGNVQPIALDVTDEANVESAVAEAVRAFGRLDVVVNNAGYGLFGAIEEITPQQARDQIETNLFGALWVTQAVLPIMREQGSGHILQVSSIGGVNAFGTLGLYHASKWGLEAFSQSLAAEVAEFGIHVTIIEPGGYSTDWAGPSSVQVTPLPAYDAARQRRAEFAGTRLPGEPGATAPVILELVDMASPPLRLFLGSYGLDLTRAEYARRIAEWERYEPLARRAQGTVSA